MPSGTDWSPRLAVFGDMGVENARALERWVLRTSRENSDLVDINSTFSASIYWFSTMRRFLTMKQIQLTLGILFPQTFTYTNLNMYNASSCLFYSTAVSTLRYSRVSILLSILCYSGVCVTMSILRYSRVADAAPLTTDCSWTRPWVCTTPWCTWETSPTTSMTTTARWATSSCGC